MLLKQLAKFRTCTRNLPSQWFPLDEMFGLDGISLAVDDQDSVYLTHDELKKEGTFEICKFEFLRQNSLMLV